MKKAIKFLFLCLLAFQFCGEAVSQEASGETVAVTLQESSGFGASRQDPKNILKDIQIRATQKDGLIPFSPLQPFRDRFKDFNDALYRTSHMPDYPCSYASLMSA